MGELNVGDKGPTWTREDGSVVNLAPKPEPEPKPVAPLIEWEPILNSAREPVAIGFRARTPTGWLVRPVSPSGGFCYVPDPEHEWGRLGSEEG